MRGLIVGVVCLVGCTRSNPGHGGGAPAPGGDGAPAVADAGGGGGSDGGASTPADLAGPGIVPQCYAEDYSPSASLSDLAAAWSSSKWKVDALEALHRRLPAGYALMDAMKDDPQLPGFVDASSWEALMTSLMTMCHEETHGYDYGHANNGTFTFFMRADLKITPIWLQNSWARSEILQYITDGSTRNYDQTYLQGQQGSYGLVELADEINAYTNGLSCIFAMADQIQSGISARDGVAASLYYLELYLRAGRTAHPVTYGMMKQSPDWQKFVAYAWARGLFWRHASDGKPQLQIADAPIWAHVEEAANVAEIELFTGRKVADIACHP